jgi:hypothetical protein
VPYFTTRCLQESHGVDALARYHKSDFNQQNLLTRHAGNFRLLKHKEPQSKALHADSVCKRSKNISNCKFSILKFEF